MTDYDTLLMIFGFLSESCSGVWPDVWLPWPSIFLADFVRGSLTIQEFTDLMAMVGPEYSAAAECAIAVQ